MSATETKLSVQSVRHLAESLVILGPSSDGAIERDLFTAINRDEKQLAELQSRLDRATEALFAVRTWATHKCPCSDNKPDPCPLCGATVATGSCKAVDKVFPEQVLAKINASLFGLNAARPEDEDTA